MSDVSPRWRTSRRAFLALAVVLAVALQPTLSAHAAAAQATAAPKPPVPAPITLPTQIEPLPPYEMPTACDPVEKTGIKRLVALLKKTYGSTVFGTTRACSGTPADEHQEGRAVDWMMGSGTTKTEANAFLHWLLATDAQHNKVAMARRMGIMYIVWQNKMFRVYQPERGWQPYQDCMTAARKSSANDTYCHRNHVHISMTWDGAAARTSYWSGKAVTVPDCDSPWGSSGPAKPSAKGLVFVALPRTPLLDSSTGLGTPSGQSCRLRQTGYDGENRHLDVTVAGVGGVPANARAVVLQVRVGSPNATAALRVSPAGATTWAMDAVTTKASLTNTGLVTVPVGAGGAVSLTLTTGQAYVSVDVLGYFVAATDAAGTLLHPSSTLALDPTTALTSTQLVGLTRAQLGVPDTATAVSLAVTLSGGTVSGGVRIYGAADPVPPVRAAAPIAGVGRDAAGSTVVRLGPGVGATPVVFVRNSSGSRHVQVVVTGWYALPAVAGGATYQTLKPTTLVDSTTGLGIKGPLTPTTAQTARLSGVHGVASTAVAVVVQSRLTSDARAQAAVWPTSSLAKALPPVSVLAVERGRPATSELLARPGDGGKAILSADAGTTQVRLVAVGAWLPVVPPATKAVQAIVPNPLSLQRISVVAKPGVNARQARGWLTSTIASSGVSVTRAGAAHPTGRSFELAVPADRVRSTLALLRADPSVESAQPVHEMSLLDVPNDPGYTDQQTYLKALDLPKAWGITHGSTSTLVAVIDSGVTTSHPEFAGKIMGTYNAVTGSTTVTDNVGHGTMVASMIAADTDNSAGIAGSGWNTGLLVVRVADAQNHINDADVAEGINWAVAHGASVINLSLGGAAAGDALKQAVAHAIASNVLIVAAAGNNSSSAKFYPAALPGVLSVGATSTGGGSRASFSERGSWVDVAAPGVGIIGASRTGSGFVSGDGTSFAAPLVSGIAALIRFSRPTLSVSGVETALTATASKSRLGFGHGVVDAYKALGYHLVLAGPTVTSPASNATVGSTVDVVVTLPVSLVADHIQARIVGRGGSVTAPVTGVTQFSGGTATLHLPAWGSAGSRTLRVVACRSSLCSPSGTDVRVAVSYAAPTLTAPSAGHVITSWAVSATSASPSVRFLADGKTTLATDTSAPFAATIAIAKLTNGSHVITAVACDARATTCDVSHASAGVTITVSHLNPAIASLSPNPFSPNGDGVRDRSTLRYSLDRTSETQVVISDSHGIVVRSVHLGSLGAGAHSWFWDGRKDGGARASTGAYVVGLTTSAVVGADTLTGTSSRSLRLDITPPSLSSLKTTYPTVYPVHDGYRDSTVLSAHVSEAASVVITVKRASGATVWSAKVSTSHAGTVRATWRGTSSSGHALTAGTYRFLFTATDSAGNVTRSAARTIGVSAKHTARRTWHKTVTALTASGGHYQKTDASSSVKENAAFGKGALRFTASPTGRVRTVNTVGLPSAVSYSSVRVDAYGRGLSGGAASLAFIDDNGAEVHGTTLSSKTGTHRGKSASATDSLLYGRAAQFELVVSGGDTYDVRSFTVTLTYLVLV